MFNSNFSAEAHRHQSGLNDLFYHFKNWFGVSDHKGGVLLLIFTIVLKMGYDSHFRHLAVEVGGPKRLYAMVTVYSAGFLALFALPVFFLTDVSLLQ
jgi:zinc transporter 5/7